MRAQFWNLASIFLLIILILSMFVFFEFGEVTGNVTLDSPADSLAPIVLLGITIALVGAITHPFVLARK